MPEPCFVLHLRIFYIVELCVFVSLKYREKNCCLFNTILIYVFVKETDGWILDDALNLDLARSTWL